jgi:hypothetical protein
VTAKARDAVTAFLDPGYVARPKPSRPSVRPLIWRIVPSSR